MMSPRWLFAGLFILLVACSGSPDSPPDGDGEATSELEADPCSGAAVDCTPGVCVAKNGQASCDCPDGYMPVRYSCESVSDGDTDFPDGDLPGDGDMECEETDRDADPEEAEDNICDHLPTDGPFAGLPCCGVEAMVFPCISDLPIVQTDNQGGFRIGATDNNNLFPLGVWNEWILVTYSSTHYQTGSYICNYYSGLCSLLTDEAASLNGSIRDNHIIWEEIEEWTEGQTQKRGSLWSSPLDKIQRIQVSDSITAKFTQHIYGDRFYWIGRNRVEDDPTGHVYTLNEQGQEEHLDQASGSVATFTVYDNMLTLLNGANQLIRLNLDDRSETLIHDYAYAVGNLAQWGHTLYATDLSNSPNPFSHCGVSIITYNLDTLERTPLKQNDGEREYWVEDVWEDWMVFVTCNEGAADDPNETCCESSGMGDIWLRYLPTGEEWNLSDAFGDQVGARMWGPLVIWRDGRNRIDGKGKALYGIDLCKHAELKSRFSECASEIGQK